MPRKNQPDLLRDLDKFDRLAKESLLTKRFVTLKASTSLMRMKQFLQA